MTPSTSIPPLSAVSMTPVEYNFRSEAVAYLRRIEHVEVGEVVRQDDVTYYAIDVYLQVNRIQSRRASVSPQSPSASQQARPHRTPDYRLLRRFRAFEELREWIWKSTDQERRSYCQYCNAWMSYISYSWTQPRYMTKFYRSNSFRRNLLSTFSRDVLDLTISSSTSAHGQQIAAPGCVVSQEIPLRVYEFFRSDTATQKNCAEERAAGSP